MGMAHITTAVVAFILGLIPFGILATVGRRRLWTSVGSCVGAGIWAALLVLWCLGIAVGIVACPNPGLPFAEAVLMGAAGGVAYMAPGLRDDHRRACTVLGAIMILLAIPGAFFLLEWPYNRLLFSMESGIVGLNLVLVGAGLLACWFVCQRRSGAVLAYLGVCLGFGWANYFVCQFKEQTILPADLLAIGTAAQVSAGYSYELLDRPVLTLCVFTLFAALLPLMPSPRLSRPKVAVNLVVGLGIAALLANWYATHDIQEDYGVTVDVWSTRESYEIYGTVPSFLQRMQEVKPRVPAGYSAQAAAELQEELAARWDEAHPGYPQTLVEARLYQRSTTGSADLPTVVAIMNESFSDLSMYPGVEGYDGVPAFDAIDTVERGALFTSVRGGGTCNSEFEYLTGTTLGSMGGGVYPYMFYDLEDVESLPAYFSSLGYRASAIHPAAAGNWRRDVVYRQLGFEQFLSEEAMPRGADTLRDLITDRVTYDVILDLLADDEGPQFIFDVTLQNHGGYDTGLLDSYPYDGVTVNGEVIDGMSEYLSCIDASQDDLDYLLGELEKLDRKVIVVFFGDHQPGFNDQISEAAYGTAVGNLTLDQVQQRFETPYFIWANYDVEAPDLTDENGGELSLSVGYLMAQTVYAAGLPLTDFQKALLQLRTEMPAVNLNGYQDAQGNWYWIGQDGPAQEAYNEYAVLQYADLFDGEGNQAFNEFMRDRAAEE